jgi:hypothetical protein
MHHPSYIQFNPLSPPSFTISRSRYAALHSITRPCPFTRYRVSLSSQDLNDHHSPQYLSPQPHSLRLNHEQLLASSLTTNDSHRKCESSTNYTSLASISRSQRSCRELDLYILHAANIYQQPPNSTVTFTMARAKSIQQRCESTMDSLSISLGNTSLNQRSKRASACYFFQPGTTTEEQLLILSGQLDYKLCAGKEQTFSSV